MHFSASMTAVGRPEQLYSWWSDYTDGVIADSSFTKVERRIVSREGNSIVMDDVFSRPLRFVDRGTLIPPYVKRRHHAPGSFPLVAYLHPEYAFACKCSFFIASKAVGH